MAKGGAEIIVAIHDVLPVGDVSQAVCEGYIRKYPNDVIDTTPLLLRGPNDHAYTGIAVRRGDQSIQIWDKGLFPSIGAGLEIALA